MNKRLIVCYLCKKTVPKCTCDYCYCMNMYCNKCLDLIDEAKEKYRFNNTKICPCYLEKTNINDFDDSLKKCRDIMDKQRWGNIYRKNSKKNSQIVN